MRNFVTICRNCANYTSSVQSRAGQHFYLVNRSITTTAPLQRLKRQQRKYRPPVTEFSNYGATHRLLRGECVRGERYGPSVELPDYTYLDGRPTPLTPEQRQLEAERKDLAQKVMKNLEYIDSVEKFNKEKEKQQRLEKEMVKQKKLKQKST